MIKTIEELIKTRTQTKWPYRVDVKNKNDGKIRAWCEAQCKGEWTLIQLGRSLHIARFKSERDMILFTLTWS